MSATTGQPVVDAGEAIERRRSELQDAAERYVKGQITVEEYEALEAKLLPDYDAMGRHLSQVSKEGNTKDIAPKRSLFDRILDIIPTPGHTRKAS